MPTPKRSEVRRPPSTTHAAHERERVLAVIGCWRRYVDTHVQHDDKHLTVRVIDKIVKEVESGYDPVKDRVDIILT